MDKEKPLTPMSKRFVSEYLIDFNATRAAKDAGSTARNLSQAGYDLLKKPEIRASLADRAAELLEKAEFTQEQVVKLMANMASYDIGEIAKANIKNSTDIAKLPRYLRDAITGWKYDANNNLTLIFADKSKALDQLARYFGIYNDKLEITVTDIGERLKRAKKRAKDGSKKK